MIVRILDKRKFKIKKLAKKYSLMRSSDNTCKEESLERGVRKYNKTMRVIVRDI